MLFVTRFHLDHHLRRRLVRRSPCNLGCQAARLRVGLQEGVGGEVVLASLRPAALSGIRARGQQRLQRAEAFSLWNPGLAMELGGKKWK